MNLDPGCLSAGKVVLATTKNQQHRIYLGSGIYAEVALRYRDGRWQPWEWTYPDYRSPEYAQVFDPRFAREVGAEEAARQMAEADKAATEGRVRW